MKTNGPRLAFRDALTYVSMDLGRVSPLNPHPSARENTARLMICLTRGRGGEGRVAESGVSSSSGEGGGGGGGGNTNRSRIASLLFALPRPLPHPELHTCQSSRPSERHLAPSSSFLALRWEDIASRCFNCRPNARYLVASVVFSIIIFFFRERRVSKFVDFRIRRSSTGKFVESFALFRLRQLPLPLLLFGKNKIIKRDRKESNEFRLSEYA